ncbi:hypothetical protein CIK05_01510 [Bdellovibrio sp. qaytius]|nr:hypothetical protein CIK05_01510 [Bdellovibrio sp. qaytius]
MKKVAHNILKRRAKAVTRKTKSKKAPAQTRNVLVENARKLLSGDINFFNKLKERNMRRRVTAPI